ncbi:MAG: hypothetical protein WC834_00470 [Eubacteriales bacterium]
MLGLKIKLLAVLTFIVFFTTALFSGCGYRLASGTVETNQPKKEIVAANLVKDILEKSLDKTKNQATKFRFQGWISSKVQKRLTNLMFNDGTYDRQVGFFIKGSLLRTNFIYYRWKDNSYINGGNKWRRVSSLPNANEPLRGFEGLLVVADRMNKLPDQKILSQECSVFQVELNGDDIRKVIPTGISIPNYEVTKTFLPTSKLIYTIWIGKKDSYIYQYETVLTMPVPGAGMLDQTTFFRFWDYNSRNINIPNPERFGIIL